jgi:hypothetical protein
VRRNSQIVACLLQAAEASTWQKEPYIHWRNAMRSFLAFGLLITLCASAGAATMHHSRHVIVHPTQGYAAYAAPRPPIHYDDNPSYDDPSKFGGDAALPVH